MLIISKCKYYKIYLKKFKNMFIEFRERRRGGEKLMLERNIDWFVFLPYAPGLGIEPAA